MNLIKILERAQLSISSGRVEITSKLGKQTEAETWVDEHYNDLVQSIVYVSKISAFQYIGYSTGSYGRHKAGGVTLQFIDILTGEQYYCVFNAEVLRVRNTRHGKKGSKLPDGHFTPPKHGSFIRFWNKLKIPLPRRLSAFHDSMSKLESIVFTGNIIESNKLDKNSLKPLDLTYEQLLSLQNC